MIFRYLTIQILGESRNACLRFILRRSNGRSNTINILFNRINFPNVTGASKERERGGGGNLEYPVAILNVIFSHGSRKERKKERNGRKRLLTIYDGAG